jgi:hypothetical protein
MSQLVTQSVTTAVRVLLSLDDVAVTGLVFGDVTCGYLKAGAGSFATKTLTGVNFVEMGSGVYEITFTAAELNTLGVFTVVVTGVDIDQSTTTVNVVADAATTVVPVTVETCVLTGHIVDPSGNPKVSTQVSASIFGRPAIEQYSLAVADDIVTVLTDANGYFQMILIRLSEVEVVIPAVDYRRRITVPNQASANLFTQVP